MNSVKRDVESLEKWEILKAYLIEKNYKRWKMQYSYDLPEGSHSWFWKEGKPQVEVITHIKEIHDDIVSNKLLKS